MMRINN
jgi:hypothetical protein